ncbi:MAG: hypothetical protein IJA10_07580 [Lachnospiraceae bacterium]|nr:hypothetical protein [Lachnospiraceae bacterium]
MNKSTKIVVLRGRELMYTGIFVVLGIILILLLILMFFPKSSKEENTTKYNPGIYTSTLTLGDSTLNVEVTVDENHIKQVNLVNIDESITTMYPLLTPTLEEINEKLSTTDNLDDLGTSQNQYTNILLIQSIKNAAKKAEIKE